jgi:DNA polymerase-3 subunit gamma/tau
MLTPPAFNALLKTLEEPPGHVKFIFCTTDPEKIPITVLSRCQRFDFPPVQTEQILGRLRFICESEGTQADDAALRVIARRAAGSMRDSQSLLEQLLSFGGDRVTVDDVHAMLGTADEARLASFASRLIQRDAAGALVELDAAIHAGVDAGQLAEQLLGYLRDMMTVAVGGPADLMRTASVSSLDQLREWGKAWGTMTLLSALQLLDETIVRMKHSVQSRILLEVALVQICSLQDLQALADVVKAFAQNQPPSSRTNPSTRVPQVPIAPIAPASISAATSVNATVEASRLSSIPSGSNRAAAGASAVDRPVGQSSPTLNDDTSKKKDEVSTFASLRMNGATTADSLDSADYAHSPKRTGPAVAIATSSGGVLDSDTESKDAAPEKIDSQESARSQNRAVTIDGVGPNDVSNSALLETFQIAASKLEGLVQQSASMAIGVVVLSERRWRVKLSKEGAYALSYFRTAENSRRLLHALREQVGHELELEFEITEVPSTQESNAAVSIPTASTVPTVPQSQMIRQAMLDPLIKRFMDTFDGQVIRVDPPAATVPPMKSVMPISQST